jgi:enoyl-CoA hydratase/carnithine racemase
VTGEIIGAADALYADLADVFVPAAQLPALVSMLESTTADYCEAIRSFAAPFQAEADPAASMLAAQRVSIDRHFVHDEVSAIVASLVQDADPFARKTLAVMQKRSPLMMCVTLEQLRRSAAMNVADCLRMERTMVRHCFEHGEVLEGVRSVVIDKDNAPRWTPASLADVTSEMVSSFFASAWPAHAHPLRELD